MDTIKNISLLGKIQAKTESMLHVIKQLENGGGVIHAIEADLMRQKIIEVYDLLLQFGTTDAPKTNTVLPTIDLEIQSETTDPWKETIKNDREEPDMDDFGNEHDVDNEPNTENEEESYIEATFVAPPEPVIEPEDVFFEAKDDEPETENTHLEQQQQAIHFREQEAARWPATPRAVKEGQPLTLDFFDDNESLADKLSSPDNSIAARMTHSKINDLRQAIGINDKFLFINELFEGNISYYNKAVDELNSFQSLNGAKTYLIELSVLHQWNVENAAVTKIEQLIERKFNL